MQCNKCKLDITGSKDSAKCSECGSCFHLSCCRIGTAAKFKKMSESSVATWRCDECCSEHSDADDSPLVVELLKSIRKEISDNRKFNSDKFRNIEEGIGLMTKTLESVKEKLLAVEAVNENLKTECKKLREDNSELSRRMWNLEADLCDLQQYSRINNVEIRGIPLTKGEDVYTVLQSIARAIGVQFQPQDISVAHRLRPPKDRRFHPSIVVQFISRLTRSQWIHAAREKKLKASDLVPSFPMAPVYISDHLTGHNKAVLGHAKSRVKQGGIAFAWSRDCKIFIRKTVDSPAIRVQTIAEIDGERSATAVDAGAAAL